MTESEDLILVRRALQADPESFNKLCQKYYHPLVAIADSILLDAHLAEDAAQEALARYMEKCLEVASRHGVPEPHFVIRTMLRRWGSCSPRGRITLNLSLVKAPVHCIEYVITHELCHLKYPNHSKVFYALLTRCQPDWRKRKALLDQIVVS